eukprot:12413329-Karenia_brevis.AAC.1
MYLRSNGGQGAHAIFRRFYINNNKFITHIGKGFTLGNWVGADEQGKTVPKSDEALQMLKDMNEKCKQE